MTEEPRSGLKNLKNRHPKVPLMIGVNRDEASFFYPMITDAYFKYGRNSLYHERELIPRFLEAATDFKGPDVQKRILPSILFHYFNGVDTNNVSSVANRFINMSSDVLYNSCVDETVKVYWSTQAPVYQYLFHYKGSNSMVSLLMNSPSHSRLWDTGVCHGDDLFLLFNMRILGLREENNRDRRISERMTTLWTDFAKTGSSPRIESFEFPRWPKWDPDSMVFYRIGEEISVGSNYKQFESFLWSHRLRNISGLGANGSHTVGFPWLTESSAGNVGIGMYSGSLISESNINKTGYQTLAWSMIVVSVSLFVLIVILVSVLYLQRRRQTFRAETPASTSHLSGSAMLY
jgi:carboxylesterase type B